MESNNRFSNSDEYYIVDSKYVNPEMKGKINSIDNIYGMYSVWKISFSLRYYLVDIHFKFKIKFYKLKQI